MTETEQQAPARVMIPAVTPDVYEALVGLTQAGADGLDPIVAELVKVRASQINACPFCLDMHAKTARADGVTQEQLDVLAAWRETPFFDERQRAALALCEAVTLIADDRVPDDVYAAAAAVYEDIELARLLTTIIAINAWNRLGISTGMQPAPRA